MLEWRERWSDVKEEGLRERWSDRAMHVGMEGRIISMMEGWSDVGMLG